MTDSVSAEALLEVLQQTSELLFEVPRVTGVGVGGSAGDAEIHIYHSCDLSAEAVTRINQLLGTQPWQAIQVSSFDA